MLHERWALSGSVALRPEPFGALAYDFASRRLSFLKSPRLVRVVESLRDSQDVAAALIAHAEPDLRVAVPLDTADGQKFAVAAPGSGPAAASSVRSSDTTATAWRVAAALTAPRQVQTCKIPSLQVCQSM